MSCANEISFVLLRVVRNVHLLQVLKEMNSFYRSETVREICGGDIVKTRDLTVVNVCLVLFTTKWIISKSNYRHTEWKSTLRKYVPTLYAFNYICEGLNSTSVCVPAVLNLQRGILKDDENAAFLVTSVLVCCLIDESETLFNPWTA